MSRAKIEHFLEDFEEGSPSSAFDETVADVELDAAALDEAAIQAKCEEMFARGLEEGRRLSAEAFDADRAELEAAVTSAREIAADDLAALGARLADDIATSIAALRGQIAESVAEILKPVLLDAVADRSVAALLEALERLTRDRDCPAVQVEGPVALVDAIASRLSARNVAVETRAATDGDVRVRVGRSTIDLRLAEWASALGPEKRVSHE